jgi:hypothetical protein
VKLPILLIGAWLIASVTDSFGETNSSCYVGSYPAAISKKGLQVEMVDDALGLGVKHAALNFNLGQLIAPRGDTNSPSLGA